MKIVRYIFVYVMFLMGIYGVSLADEYVVSTYSELKSRLAIVNPGDTILLADGTFTISGDFALAVRTSDITIKSQSGNREAVIVKGQGMSGNVNHGFWIDANNVTIQDITIQEVYNHGIQLDVNIDGVHIKNCIFRDTREQMLKVPYNTNINDPSEDGIIEDCLFMYSAGVGPQYYIGGIDVHFGKNYIVRNNTFQDIQSPGGGLAEHAIHFWSSSENTLVEKNLIINCDRGIGFGLGTVPHIGGIIRNNIIYHDGSGTYADVGIGLESSSNTKVYNNTIYFNHNRYPNAIEYRFSGTYGAYIANNLTNKLIVSRNSGTGTLENNVTNCQSNWLVNILSFNLHLAYKVDSVVNQGVIITGLTDDFDGDRRPMGGGIDIGADEYKIRSTPINLLLLKDSN
ncbi:MAG: right-handed parallel beta-helix repeat-containing protein [Desulfobacterales bacterium]|nr:right-handed parallel beta-helix repeat-containing protein [Desulfobacterales bacterium]